jgi:tetratricopeptide (TPR) repeat protein
MNLQKIGKILRAERKKRGLRLEDLANENLSVTTLSNIERGLPNVIVDRYMMYAESLGLADGLFGIVSESELEERKIKKRLIDIEEMLNADPNKALSALDVLNKETEILNTSNFASMAHYLYGKCYVEKRKNNKVSPKAKEHFLITLKTIDSTPTLENSNYKAITLNELGRIAYFENDYKTALEYVVKALFNFLLNGERKDRKYSLLLNKIIYLDELGYEEKTLRALEELEGEIILLKKSGEDLFEMIEVSTVIQMYTMFANILTKMNSPESALEYAKKGIKIARINRRYERLFTLWTIVGNIYSSLEDYEEAETYYIRALDIRPKISIDYLFPFNYTNYGLLLIKLNRLQEARDYIEESIKISQSINNNLGYTKALIAMGKWYLEKNMYTEALSYYNQTEELAQQYELITEQLEAVADLCTCYLKVGDKKAYQQYTEKLHQLYIQRRN